MTPTDLPDSISYLAPVIARLREFDPDSLDEDNDEAGAVVESAARSRVADLDRAGARTRIINDYKALRTWADRVGPGDAVISYLVGSLMGLVFFGFDAEGPSGWLALFHEQG